MNKEELDTLCEQAKNYLNKSIFLVFPPGKNGKTEPFEKEYFLAGWSNSIGVSEWSEGEPVKRMESQSFSAPKAKLKASQVDNEYPSEITRFSLKEVIDKMAEEKTLRTY